MFLADEGGSKTINGCKDGVRKRVNDGRKSGEEKREGGNKSSTSSLYDAAMYQCHFTPCSSRTIINGIRTGAYVERAVYFCHDHLLQYLCPHIVLAGGDIGILSLLVHFLV